MTRSALAWLAALVSACAGAPAEVEPLADRPILSPWLTPSASTGASAPPPVPGPTAPRSPDVVIDPNAPIIQGPAGAMRSVPGPSGGDPISTPRVPFDRVRQQLEVARQAMRRCYQRALQTDPNQRGKLAARVVFDAKGDAVRVEIVENEGAGDELARCIGSALQRLAIEPGDGERVLVIPFVLVPG